MDLLELSIVFFGATHSLGTRLSAPDAMYYFWRFNNDNYTFKACILNSKFALIAQNMEEYLFCAWFISDVHDLYPRFKKNNSCCEGKPKDNN